MPTLREVIDRNVVSTSPATTVRALLELARQRPSRIYAWVVAPMPPGAYAVTRLNEIAGAAEELGVAILDMALDQVPGLLRVGGPVQANVALDEAVEQAHASPGERIAVLEGEDVMGVLNLGPQHPPLPALDPWTFQGAAHQWPYDTLKLSGNYVILEPSLPASELAETLANSEKSWIYLVVPAGAASYRVMAVRTAHPEALRVSDLPLPPPVPSIEEGAVSWEVARERVLGTLDRCLPVTRGGQVIGVLAEPVRGVPGEVHAARAEPHRDERRVLVQVLDTSRPAEQQVEKQALRVGQKYAFDVCIAAPTAEWLAAAERFPTEEIDFSRGPVTLRAVFTEPRLSPEPQVRKLVLPREGPSSVCHFRVRTPKQAGSFRARIAIVYRNRVLQTVLVTGSVLSAEQPLLGDETIKVRLEAVVGPGFGELESRRHFHAALVLNHDGAGVPTATGIADGKARWIHTERFQVPIDLIKAKLTEMADAIKRDATLFTKIESDETVHLLLYLALQGSVLYQGLVKDWGLKLPESGRIQIAAMDFDRFLPVEFFYDRPPPARDAKLCRHPLEAWREGRECETACPEPKSSVICPLGFWCLRHVIERHTFDSSKDEGQVGDYQLIPESPVVGRQRLNPLRSAVFAASKRVDAKGQPLRDAVMKTLSDLIGPQVGRAETWDEWKQKVSEIKPSLLMLLPHTLLDDMDMATMEIGDGAQIEALTINEDTATEYVRPSESLPPPIVFLLGCDTGAKDLSFDNFVAPFRRAKAALVVTTLSTVLGRHAAPMAQAFVQALSQMGAQDSLPFGEVTLAVRRKLLAGDMPAALTLAVYGDADWILDTKGG